MKQNKTDDYDVSNAYPHWRPFFAMTGVSCHTGEVVILWIVVMIFTRSMFANTTRCVAHTLHCVVACSAWCLLMAKSVSFDCPDESQRQEMHVHLFIHSLIHSFFFIHAFIPAFIYMYACMLSQCMAACFMLVRQAGLSYEACHLSHAAYGQHICSAHRVKPFTHFRT